MANINLVKKQFFPGNDTKILSTRICKSMANYVPQILKMLMYLYLDYWNATLKAYFFILRKQFSIWEKWCRNIMNLCYCYSVAWKKNGKLLFGRSIFMICCGSLYSCLHKDSIREIVLKFMILPALIFFRINRMYLIQDKTFQNRNSFYSLVHNEKFLFHLKKVMFHTYHKFRVKRQRSFWIFLVRSE